MSTDEVWSCSSCGQSHGDSTSSWCAAGCGRDYQRMVKVPRWCAGCADPYGHGSEHKKNCPNRGAA